MKTEDCIKLIEAEDLSSLSFLIKGSTTGWKRFNKFKYKDGIRRYFYLPESCVIATVDDVNGHGTVVVRPPMTWEMYWLQNLKPDDSFIQNELIDVYDEHDNTIIPLAAKYSEPEQYRFSAWHGSNPIGLIEDNPTFFFSPKKMDGYDQPLSGDLDNILPVALRGEEVMECTYDQNGVTKEQLEALGFEYYIDPNEVSYH